MTPTIRAPAPVEPSSSSRVLKIVGIIFLVCVALCGIAGSCLLLITFFLPQGGGQ
jgi:hypothetical protein